MGLFEVLGGSKLNIIQGKSHGKIEAIVGCLIDDNEHVFFGGEIIEIDRVFRGGEKVAELAQFGLEGDGVEKVDKVGVSWVTTEMLLQENIYA